MLLDSDVFIAIIKEKDRLKRPSLKILRAVEKGKAERCLCFCSKYPGNSLLATEQKPEGQNAVNGFQSS